MFKKMLKQRKGMEKPIEIFVALFVILAVALLVLQLFQSQLTEQQQTLQEEAHKREQDSIMQTARDHCNSACSAASNRGCSTAAMASFCLQYASDAIQDPRFIDLDLDMERGSDSSLLAGLYVCEDAVPCHAMIDTCCGRRVNHNTCKETLETYWKDQGFTTAGDKPTLLGRVRAGICDKNTSNMHWYQVANFSGITLN